MTEETKRIMATGKAWELAYEHGLVLESVGTSEPGQDTSWVALMRCNNGTGIEAHIIIGDNEKVVAAVFAEKHINTRRSAAAQICAKEQKMKNTTKQGIKGMVRVVIVMAMVVEAMLHTGCATNGAAKRLAAEEMQVLRDAGFKHINLLDEFGNVSGEGISVNVAGDFSNSATDSSPAFALIVAKDDGSSWIRIWEYNRRSACESFASRRYNPAVRIQDAAGNRYNIPATGNTTNIILKDPSILATALRQGDVRMVVSFNEYPEYGIGSTYRFTIGGKK